MIRRDFLKGVAALCAALGTPNICKASPLEARTEDIIENGPVPYNPLDDKAYIEFEGSGFRAELVSLQIPTPSRIQIDTGSLGEPTPGPAMADFMSNVDCTIIHDTDSVPPMGDMETITIHMPGGHRLSFSGYMTDYSVCVQEGCLSEASMQIQVAGMCSYEVEEKA